MDTAVGMRVASLTPTTMRAANRSSKLGAHAQSVAPTAQVAAPAVTRRLRLIRSANRPSGRLART